LPVMSSDPASDTPSVTPVRVNGTPMEGEWASIPCEKGDKLRPLGALGGKRTVAIFCRTCNTHLVRKGVFLDRIPSFKHRQDHYCFVTHVWK